MCQYHWVCSGRLLSPKDEGDLSSSSKKWYCHTLCQIKDVVLYLTFPWFYFISNCNIWERTSILVLYYHNQLYHKLHQTNTTCDIIMCLWCRKLVHCGLMMQFHCFVIIYVCYHVLEHDILYVIVIEIGQDKNKYFHLGWKNILYHLCCIS